MQKFPTIRYIALGFACLMYVIVVVYSCIIITMSHFILPCLGCINYSIYEYLTGNANSKLPTKVYIVPVHYIKSLFQALRQSHRFMIPFMKLGIIGMSSKTLAM